MTRVEKALDLITSYGGIDEAHHKQWVLDQVVRALTGTTEDYNRWIELYENDGEYEWEMGTAP